MSRTVIVSAARTPIGKFGGAFADLPAVELGAVAVKAALAKSSVKPEQVDAVLMGNVLQANLGQNPARQVLIRSGIPVESAATTINKVCGSGMEAAMLADLELRAGDKRIVVAGGMESMSNCPFYLPKARFGYKMNDGAVVDGMVHDGLWDIFNDYHMGNTGEIVAQKHGITREDVDRFSLRSHQLALKAWDAGHFRDEVAPVEIKQKKETLTVAKDEGPRADASLERLAKLKPVFKADGIVTAGNASQLSDGAAALVLMKEETAKELGIVPLARILDHCTSGVKPELIMEAPIPGIRKILERNKLSVGDIDQWEHNEAFASASVAVQKTFAIPEDRFNVNGGAVALGHPIGCSGARVVVTLLHTLKRSGGHRGIASLCLGGGNATTMLVERI